MQKQEFMEKLRLALSGRVSAETVADNIRYYEEYINIEIRKGRSEEEILEQLGDPRLIARTIVQTHGNSGKGRAADESGNTRVFSERSAGGYTDEPGRKRFFNFHIPGWLSAVVILILFTAFSVLVLAVVFSVMSIILPVLLIILAVSFLVKLFRDWLN